VRPFILRDDDRLGALEWPGGVDLAVEDVGSGPHDQHEQQDECQEAVEEAQEGARPSRLPIILASIAYTAGYGVGSVPRRRSENAKTP